MRGTIRSGSLAAYCVHSPRGAKRLDRLNLRSRAGEITAARHPEAARESNQGLATARALAVAWPLSVNAQQGERVRRIGVLMGDAEDDPGVKARLVAFQQGLDPRTSPQRPILTDAVEKGFWGVSEQH